MNPLRPGSVLNAIVAIAPRKGTCGLNRACWVYASHTLPVWMARCMILQVSISCCLPVRLVSNKPVVHLRVCVYQQSLLIFRKATEKVRVFLADHFTLSHVTFYDTILFSEWAGCQRIGISPDTHRVPYHISFGSKNNSNATRHRYIPLGERLDTVSNIYDVKQTFSCQ